MFVSRLLNRNVTLPNGHRTSIRLEPELWAMLTEICHREDIAVGDLIERIGRGVAQRTSAVRVYILQYLHAAVTEQGHRKAGHGAKPHTLTAS